jgi:hypothetical protein
MAELDPTGVDSASAAATQGQGNDPGSSVSAPAAAPAATGDVLPDLPPNQQEAFAKRLAAEKAKLERQFEPYVRLGEALKARGADPETVLAQLEQPQIPSPAGPVAPQAAITPESVAEQLGTTPEMARVLLQMAQQNLTLTQQQQKIADEAEAIRLRAEDPSFDRAAAEKAQRDFQRRYGVRLSLADAWAYAGADIKAAKAAKEAEQRALQQQQVNQRSGTSEPGTSAGKPSIADLPKSDFEALVARVKATGRIA